MSPIADTVTRIKNALAASHMKVEVPFSKFRYELVRVLENEGYVKKIEKKGKGIKKTIEVSFNKVSGEDLPKSFEIRLISKPGQRIFTKSKSIKAVRGGLGTEIVSTSRGLMSGKEAKKKNLGGELICEVI